MAIHVALNHVSHYRYDRSVAMSPHIVRLRPAPHCRTKILSYSLKIEPATHFVNWQQDSFANHLARLVFNQPTTEFKVSVDLVAEMSVYNPFEFFLEPEAETFPYRYDAGQAQELAPYLAKDESTPALAAWLAGVDRTPRRMIDFLVGINQRLCHDVRYVIRMEPGVQTPEQTLTLASGSCRDTGWLMVQALRHLGLAARFVSGYLIQLKPDVAALDGPSGSQTDFTDLHAWCEVYLPGAGWIGLDPTSGLFAGEGHIPLACTPQPSSAAPVSGGVDDCEVEFEHHMAVTRIFESPRVTLPYTDAQWRAVLALGESVDRQLLAGDVRLTMGGEPTFVAIDDRDGAEWNTDALGPTKRIRAQDLVQRLRQRYGQGGFLHFGQGKWYPGEQLPRWALSICWRADGQPCWTDPTLFADEREAHRYTADDASRFIAALATRLGVTGQHIQAGYEDTWYHLWRERRLPVNVDPFDSRLEDAMERERLRRVFTQGLASVVGYALPLKASDEETLRAGPRWHTGAWFIRDERMVLIPGDSPMGYRLPLDSQPWVKESQRDQRFDVDPFAPREVLTAASVLRSQGAAPAAGSAAVHGAVDAALPEAPTRAPKLHESAHWITRSALVVEVRDPTRANGPPAAPKASGPPAAPGANGPTAAPEANGPPGAPEAKVPPAESGANGPPSAPGADGSPAAPEANGPAAAPGGNGPPAAPGGNGPPAAAEANPIKPNPAAKPPATPPSVLYVFMPPLQRLEDYLELLAAVEATAAAQGVKIVLEGYPPPRDPRLKLLQVTPDPGVIEVNIHPAHDWAELVEHTEFLYDAAFQSRLSSEKFMLDGRHTGTGGGNHVVLGGATPADSPFLRRPDLLASLLAYWHNHPALSYLFSGMFIGPTSQAPRVDEARNDQLYELEIAIAEIQRAGKIHGQRMPPWTVDRALRNILVDVTGNTHRSEFCIDKMYSPDSSTGRLGLLELRAFEMPPHARMSIVQQLLLRALVARFWHQPYRAKLVRWGTALHDRFMLPSVIWSDLQDVLADMNLAGYGRPQADDIRRPPPFMPEWFAPHFEFRFPKIGELHASGVPQTLRSALEPWHGMGEEGAAGTTVRDVDSSLERLEIMATGLVDSRHAVTVNGVTLPLQATGRAGEYVCGVRYRAWQPPSALHPTIGVDAPLTIDLVDRWMQRSLGGGQYHVAHPGGLSHSLFPVNAYEAESRRLSRFLTIGHTPGKIEVAAALHSLEFPFTLDLRTAARPS